MLCNWHKLLQSHYELLAILCNSWFYVVQLAQVTPIPLRTTSYTVQSLILCYATGTSYSNPTTNNWIYCAIADFMLCNWHKLLQSHYELLAILCNSWFYVMQLAQVTPIPLQTTSYTVQSLILCYATGTSYSNPTTNNWLYCAIADFMLCNWHKLLQSHYEQLAILCNSWFYVV